MASLQSVTGLARSPSAADHEMDRIGQAWMHCRDLRGKFMTVSFRVLKKTFSASQMHSPLNHNHTPSAKPCHAQMDRALAAVHTALYCNACSRMYHVFRFTGKARSYCCQFSVAGSLDVASMLLLATDSSFLVFAASAMPSSSQP